MTKDSSTVENLDEVMVTATRTIKQLASLPLPAQIILKKEIERSNSVRLNDILDEQTGLITIPDYGGAQGIQLQGLDAQYTLILIDGVPLVGRSAGTLDMSRITVGNIKQIEIVKGASSSLYGSEALGGVINLITESPKTGFKGTGTYRLSSFNTHDLNTSINYKKTKLGISAFINRYSSDGYDLNKTDQLKTVDPFSNYTFNTKINYDFSKTTTLSVSSKYFTQNQDYIASPILKGESDINEWSIHSKLSHQYHKKWRSYFEFYATRYIAKDYLNHEDGSRFNDSYFNQLLIRPEIRGTFNPTETHTIIGGLGFNHETLNRTYFTIEPVFNSPYLYVQYDGNLMEKINMIVGARFDSHNKYKSQFSPKLAVRYVFNEKFALKGSIGYGFKAPDFRQLYFDFTNATIGYTVLGYHAVATAIPKLDSQDEIANIIVPLTEFDEELNPENSISINMGFDYRLKSNLKLELNLFRNHINDLIDTRIIANKTNGQNIFSYYNVNKVYTQGLELNTNWKPTQKLKISGGYQLLFSREKNPESFQIKKEDYFGLYNTSRHMANLKLFYAITKWKLDANVRATYRSKYGLFDSNGNNYLDVHDDFANDYTIIDFAINKTIYKNYQLSFGIDNLFDFTDTQNISNIAGRTLYGKIHIQF